MPKTKHADYRVATNRTPRRINSSVVLNTVRRRQPISRVELARLSGLQPSTVSLIVEELLETGWLLEGETVKGAMGRRPTLLSISDQYCVLAVDIHPLQSSLAVVDMLGEIVWQSELHLSQSPSHAVPQLIKAIQRAIQSNPDRKFQGIGICLPGRTDPNATELIFAPNLRWPITSLKSKIEKATGLRVEMDNVANACALLEVWTAQEDKPLDLVVVEVSEGIGTGLFVNGAIVRGIRGMAGEFGHVQMSENGPDCNCGARGCWEAVASNRATLGYYREAGGERENASFGNVLELALRADPAACAALSRTAMYLGRGLQMITVALAPAEIVIVGDITAAWASLEGTLLAKLQEHPLAKTVRVRPAENGGTARLRCAVPLLLADRFMGSHQVD